MAEEAEAPVIEDGEAQPEAEVVEEVEEETVMTVEMALQTVLKRCKFADTFVKGLHEATKAIEAKRVELCVLAEDCSADNYKQLIKLLCKEQNIPIFETPSREALGQWSGLCKYDEEMKPRNIRPCSCVCINALPQGNATDIIKAHVGIEA